MESKGGVGILDPRQKLCRDRMERLVSVHLAEEEGGFACQRREEGVEAVGSIEYCADFLLAGSGCPSQRQKARTLMLLTMSWRKEGSAVDEIAE